MKLYTFYKENEKVVYGTTVDCKMCFFFSGFASAEEAKETTFRWHYNHRLKQSKPNSQGICRPSGMLKAEIEMSLSGEWSEIQ